MKKLTAATSIAAVFGTTYLGIAYFCAYLLLLQIEVDRNEPRSRVPNYRFGGGVAEIAFRPAQKVDQAFWPFRWEPSNEEMKKLVGADPACDGF